MTTQNMVKNRIACMGRKSRDISLLGSATKRYQFRITEKLTIIEESREAEVLLSYVHIKKIEDRGWAEAAEDIHML